MANHYKRISTVGILFASISAMVGSGWLFGPLFAARIAGPSSLLSWVIGGLLMLVIGFTFAELTTALPISGGTSAYAYFSHGSLFGFIMGWTLWTGLLFTISIEIRATLQYASNYLPWLVSRDGSTVYLSALGTFIAALIMFGISLINSISSNATSETNKYITYWKLMVPVSLAFIFLFYAKSPENLWAKGGFATGGLQGILGAIATGGVIYAYNGFQYGLMLAGEVKNPKKSIPIAAIGSILACILLYFILQLSFIVALPSQTLEGGWPALTFDGDAGPLAGLATLLGLGWLVHVLYIDAVFSPLGAGLVQNASAARTLQAVSMTGSLPRWLSQLNKGGVPVYGVWINFIVGMIFLLPFHNMETMISILSTVLVVTYLVGPVCLLALRKQQPKLNRPFALPMVTVFAFTAFYICNLLILWTGPTAIAYITGVVVSGMMIFLATIAKNKTKSSDFKNALWILPNLLGLWVLSIFSVYGGNGSIPFGYDFLWTAVFSGIMLYISYISRLDQTSSKGYTDLFLKKSSQ